MFEVTGKLTITASREGSRLTLKGGVSTTGEAGNIVKVIDGGTLILENGVFCGGKIQENISGAVLVRDGSTFEMTGGVIEDFTLTASMLTGTVCVTSGGTFHMFGGTIQNNENSADSWVYYCGGGVLLYAWNKAEPDAVMTLSGNAVIQNNLAMDGGGVYLVGNTDFQMTGGTITNNWAISFGGGVCVAGTGGSVGGKGGASASDTKFVMSGGTISNNRANRSGGGVYVNSDSVTLKGGKIVNNTASNHGGGVYVSEPPQVVKIYNAVVTGNTATLMGGGLWFCPTGDATFSVTNGIAVYENHADRAGDDFVSLSGSTGKVTLADRMLGGGAVEWYRDGAVNGGTGGGSTPPQNVTGSVDSSVARFDPENPGERLTGITGSGNYALKAVVSEKAVELAESQATLWITGNTARRGGGIGSNGAALLGEEGQDYTLRVTKKWSENTPEDEKKEITVVLKIGEYELDPVVLNAANQWTAKFTQLPNPESLEGDLQYAVVESPVPANFTPVYQEAVTEGNTIYIEVTNTYTPQQTTVQVTKVWNDNNGQNGIRPESITVKLLANGEDTGKTCLLSDENGWNFTFNGLEKYENGKEIVYTIEEVEVEGYETSITGSAAEGFVITNTWEDEPDTPDNPPDEPDEPDTPDNPPDEPDEPDTPDNPPDKPDEPDTPDNPPDEPDKPDEPDTPDNPDTPDEPDEPDEPTTDIPDDPTPEGDVPGDPDTPDQPDQPDEPGLPQTGQQWLLAGLLALTGAGLVLAGLWYKTRYRGKHEA